MIYSEDADKWPVVGPELIRELLANPPANTTTGTTYLPPLLDFSDRDEC